MIGLSSLSFLFSGRWKWILIGLAAVSIVAILFLGYRHYNNMLEEIGTLKANNAKQAMALTIQDDTIAAQAQGLADWKDAMEDLRKDIEALNKAAAVAQEQTRRLNEIFSKHNLAELAKRKPGLIERSLNNGTADVFRMLQQDSGPDGAHSAGGD